MVVSTNNGIIRSYIWGTDQSGSFQGAGGVGGLLKLTYNGTQTTNCFVAFDGNGNVSGLVDAANGTVIAQYDYGPFGEALRISGSMAAMNPLRFSTKYQDNQAELICFGHRFLGTGLGRWANQDPLGDKAFLTFHAKGKSEHTRRQLEFEGLQPRHLFVQNDPVDHYDICGLNIGFPICGYGCIPVTEPSACDKAISAAARMIGNIQNDARAHCIASCEINKGCGKWVCKCLGTVKECRDLGAGAVEWVCSWVLTKKAEEWLHDNLQGGTIDDSAKDFAANDWGMSIAQSGGDCTKECEARYGPEP